MNTMQVLGLLSLTANAGGSQAPIPSSVSGNWTDTEIEAARAGIGPPSLGPRNRKERRAAKSKSRRTR